MRESIDVMERLCAGADSKDIAASACEIEGNGAADASRGARDDGSLACEVLLSNPEPCQWRCAAHICSILVDGGQLLSSTPEMRIGVRQSSLGGAPIEISYERPRQWEKYGSS